MTVIPKFRYITYAAVVAIFILGFTSSHAQQDGQAFLGVRVVNGPAGAQVVEVLPGSPAERAGFQPGDLIASVNEDRISTADPLDVALARLHPGDQVLFTVVRGDRTIQLNATLGVMAQSTGLPTVEATVSATIYVTPIGTPLPPAATTGNPGGGFLGVRLINSPNGVRVVAVLPGSPAEQAGIRPGDVISAVDGTTANHAEQVQAALSSKAPGDSVTLQISRDGQTLAVNVRLSARQPEAPATVVSPPGATPSQVIGVTFPALGFYAVLDPRGLHVADERPDGPARQGGLLVGDVIINVDGQSFNAQDVGPMLARLLAPQRPRLVVLRDGSPITIQLAVGSTPGQPLPPAPVLPPANVSRGKLGVSYVIVTPSIAAQRGLSVDYGALVTEVVPGSPADLAGIRPGDVITAVDGDKVDAKRTLTVRMAPYNPGDSLTLTVVRDGNTMQVTITLAVQGVALAPDAEILV